MITDKTTKTIKNVKKTLCEVNNDINSMIDELIIDERETCAYGKHDYDKETLRSIRDKNIETILLLKELQLRGVIDGE